MSEVIVSGRVVSTDDGRALVPASLDPQDRADCAIILTGANLPPPACNASARGEMIDQRLAVAEWSLDPDPHPANVPLSDLPGADSAAVDRALDTLPVEDSNMISVGADQVIDGKTRAQIQVVSATAGLAAWLADQPPGSVYVYPFIRDADTPSVWVAGRRP